MSADEGVLVLDIENFMAQIVCNLHEPGNHELIVYVDKVLHEDGKPTGSKEADVCHAAARTHGDHEAVVFLLMHMELSRAFDLFRDVQRGRVGGLLRRLHDLRHEAFFILIGRAVARDIDALHGLAVLQSLHVLVDVDARSSAFVEAEIGRAFHAHNARGPNQRIARNHRAVCQRERIRLDFDDCGVFQQRYAELFEVLVFNFLDELFAVEHAKDAIERFDIIDRDFARIDIILPAKMLFGFAEFANHLDAGEAAAADRKGQQALSLRGVVFIRSALKHVLHMCAQLDRVLIGPKRMRIFSRTLHSEEVRLAADRDDQIVKLIRALFARNALVCDVALRDFVRNNVDLSAAKDLS